MFASLSLLNKTLLGRFWECFLKRVKWKLGTEEEKNYKRRHCLESMYFVRPQFHHKNTTLFYWNFSCLTNVTVLSPDFVAKPLLLDWHLSEPMWFFPANLWINLFIWNDHGSHHTELAVRGLLKLLSTLLQRVIEGHSAALSVWHARMCHR